MTCNIHTNLFIPKDFCLLPNTPTNTHYRNLFMSPWKAATSREECCTFLQRRFRVNCSEVYPVLLPCFSSSLLASSYWHHQLLTLREAYPNHCSTTQSQLFHLSHSSPAPSSLWCAILPWVSQQPPTCFPLTLCVLKGHILPLIFF